MMNCAYIVWAVTALFSLWRFMSDREDSRVLRRGLLEKYGEECCAMLQNNELRGLADSPPTHSSRKRAKKPSQSQAEKASRDLAKEPSPRPGNLLNRK